MSTDTFVNLIQDLHDFCAQATAEREVSHGWQHMDKVRENSLQIWEEEKVQYMRNDLYDIDHMTRLIIAVAQLHDVADHKYGKTEEQLRSVSDELHKHFSTADVRLIQAIIDNVSYSKEAKQRIQGRQPSWEELGAEGRVVRAVVSDADKIEAIGLIGLQRCMQYSAEVMHKKGLSCDITPCKLITDLIAHGQEKLFILMDEYIVTAAGKALAKPSHDVMMAEAALLEESCSCLKEQQVQGGVEERQRQVLEAFEGGRILLSVIAEQ